MNPVITIDDRDLLTAKFYSSKDETVVIEFENPSQTFPIRLLLYDGQALDLHENGVYRGLSQS